MQKEKGNTYWHTISSEQVLELLSVAADSGLSSADAASRMEQYGLNELKEKAGRTAFSILWEQASSTMSLILSSAALLSLLVGSYKDAVTIIAIVVLFVLLGFVQDYRAEKAIAALKKLSVPLVRVIRDGLAKEIPASHLTVGDIVLLEAGSVVPADCRLLEAHALRVQESILTGESEATEKHSEVLQEKEIALGDRRNLIFMGTLVSAGRAVAVVFATGMQTELGKIAVLLQSVGQEWTPLQKRLDKLGKVLAFVSIMVAALIFFVGLLRGEPLKEMLLMAVSVAVAAIPEGLPAVVTITLALGAQRMLKRKALIRRLPAVETLGSVTVICTDKTGTLTQNRMTVTALFSAEQILEGLGEPGSFKGETERLILMITALCNDAVLKNEKGTENILGDPTEGAFLSAAAGEGIFRQELEQLLPRVAEIPFDSVTKRMITVHEISSNNQCGLQIPLCPSSGKLLAAKGAIDSVLSFCSHLLINGREEILTEKYHQMLHKKADLLSSAGERVLAIAMRTLMPDDDDRLESLEHGFRFIGLAAMTDPPRPEAKEAVLLCRSAGIRAVMITGDHPLTAQAIARQVGIDEKAGALTGQELETLSDNEFDTAISKVSVYARVSPEHKLRIVDSIQRQGGVAAMTGDGVNDAPALKKADVGVAMGKVGTDVAREASDMVLLDDNFATIVAAVEEGRTIYENIRKFIVFSVAGNIGKILSVLILPFVGLPMPLTPLQLLWLNLLTDGLLGLGMGVERAEPDVMKRPPITSDSQIFDSVMIRYVLLTGSLIGVLCMFLTIWVWRMGGPWQTVLFASLAVAQVAQAMALRSFRSSFLKMGLFSNPLLSLMALFVVLLQVMAIYIPSVQTFFRTVPLSINQLLLVMLPAAAVFLVLEGWKVAGRNNRESEAK